MASDLKIGDRVIYSRGAKGVLYGKVGTIISPNRDDGLFEVKFDNFGSCGCLASNLDLVKE